MIYGIIKSTKTKTYLNKKGSVLMSNYTTETYQMKREIFSFSKKVSKGSTQDKQKFTADMIYGLLSSESCLLSDIADHLKETIRKKNTIDRLSRHLADGVSATTERNYKQLVRRVLSEDTLVFVDDSDVIKPYGQKYEDLGWVRDGSAQDNRIEKGYHVTEITALTKSSQHPVSLYSNIHSSQSKDYISVNDITFSALQSVFPLVGKDATFIFDRGYDMNKLFTFFHKADRQFIVRLKENRSLYYNRKWYKSTELRDTRKGKYKTTVRFHGEKKDCYLTSLTVQITESKRPIHVIFVYGLGETPMMLATNRDLQGKDDVVRAAKAYFKRWRIEEYFRFKKQHFRFENFRVRSLKAINALNSFITYAIGFVALMSEKPCHSHLKMSILKRANVLRADVCFCFYRLAKGIAGILEYAAVGINGWFKHKRPKYRQLTLFEWIA